MKSPRTFPRLVMKEWPMKQVYPAMEAKREENKARNELERMKLKAVSDFTRVCADMKILDADKIAE